MSKDSAEKFSFHIGNGIHIGWQKEMDWFVWAKESCFDLKSIPDFTRVLLLLERPFQEACTLVSNVSSQNSSGDPFPMWKVVAAGLDFGSDQWASLALTWVPNLPVEDKARLEPLLESVRTSKWASQKTRQLAHRHIREMKSRGQA